MASDAIPAYRDETINCLVRRRASMALDGAGRETKKDKVPVYLMVVKREVSGIGIVLCPKSTRIRSASVLGYRWWGMMQVLALGSLTPSLQSLRLAYIRVARTFRTHHHRGFELYTYNAIPPIRAFV